MFTGIIEATGVISSISDQGSNKTFLISSPLAPSLRVDQSLSHDGVCLTVESITGDKLPGNRHRRNPFKDLYLPMEDRNPVSIWKDACRSMDAWTDIWYRAMWIPPPGVFPVRTRPEAGYFVSNFRHHSEISSSRKGP